MEINRGWNKALLYTGQGIRSEDVVKYAGQLREVDTPLLEANIDAAEKASELPIASYLVKPDDIFSNNAALQLVVHTLNVTAGDIALAEIADTEGLVVAGHSLGEVAAFDAVKVFLSRRASMEFVYARGTAMQRAHEKGPGSLYSIEGLTEAQVDEISLELEAVSALINGPQLIVVGSSPERTDLEEAAKKAGARKVTDLHIPAFHTLYMDEARIDLEVYNYNRQYHDALFPVVSNLTGQPILDGYRLIGNHIANVVNPVRWVDSIVTIYHEGVTFYTLGPGNNPAILNRLNGVPKEQTRDLFQLLAE